MATKKGKAPEASVWTQYDQQRAAKRINLTMTDDVRERADRLAAAYGESVSAVVARALELLEQTAPKPRG